MSGHKRRLDSPQSPDVNILSGKILAIQGVINQINQLIIPVQQLCCKKRLSPLQTIICLIESLCYLTYYVIQSLVYKVHNAWNAELPII